MHCLVIGNGESRRGINLQNFPNHILVGCNAIHRDHPVDHLICCDRRMVEEAIISDHTTNTKIYVRPEWFKYFRKIKKDKRINQVPDLPYEGNNKIDHPFHWGSGAYAILVAANLNPQSITLIGFDLYPLKEKINNLYKGTNNYAPSKAKPVDSAYWVYQISKVFNYFPNIEFNILNKEDWEIPKTWKYSNVKFNILATKNLTFTK